MPCVRLLMLHLKCRPSEIYLKVLSCFPEKNNKIHRSLVQFIVEAEHDEIFNLHSQAFAACCRATETEQWPSHTLQNSCTEPGAGEKMETRSRALSTSDPVHISSVGWHVSRTEWRMSGMILKAFAEGQGAVG